MLILPILLAGILLQATQTSSRKPAVEVKASISRSINGTSSFYRSLTRTAKSCSCLVCGAGNVSSNKKICVSTLSRVDGMGSQAVYILDVLSYLFHRGWQFCGMTQFFEAHGVQHAYRFYDFLFGDHRYVDLFSQVSSRCGANSPTSTPCVFLDTNESSVLESIKASNPTIVRWNAQAWALERFYDSQFINLVRRGAACGIMHSYSHSHLYRHGEILRHSDRKKEVGYPLIVAAHLRLGDAFADTYRYPAFQLYRQVFELLLRLRPTAEFHVFTSVEPRFPFNETFVLQYFSGINVTVHIDDEATLSATSDVTRAIAHMALADVLVTARSSFSYLAGLLNNNCVLYQPFYSHYYHPLPGWLELPEEASDTATITSVVLEKLPACLSRL